MKSRKRSSRDRETQRLSHTIHAPRFMAIFSAVVRPESVSLSAVVGGGAHSPFLNLAVGDRSPGNSFNLRGTLASNKGSNDNDFEKFFRQSELALAKQFRTAQMEPPLGWKSERERLAKFVRLVQRTFLNSLKNDIIEKAQRFQSRHWQVYRLLSQHSSSRVQELTETCPGLIAALADLEFRGVDPYFIDRILSRVKRTKELDFSVLELFSVLWECREGLPFGREWEAGFNKGDRMDNILGWAEFMKTAPASIDPCRLLRFPKSEFKSQTPFLK